MAKVLASIIAVMIFYGSYELVKLQNLRSENKKIKDQMYSEEKIQSAINLYADMFERFPTSLEELVDIGLLDHYDLLVKADENATTREDFEKLATKCEDAIRSYKAQYNDLPSTPLPECETISNIKIMHLNGMELENNLSNKYLSKIRAMRAHKNPLYDANETLYKYVRLKPEISLKVANTLKKAIKQKLRSEIDSNFTLLTMIETNATTSIIALDGILKLLNDTDINKSQKLELVTMLDKVIESDIIIIKESLSAINQSQKSQILQNYLNILRSQR